METHKDSRISKSFENAYEWFCKDLFTDNLEDFRLRFKGLFPIDCKAFLEEYFGIRL